MSIVYFTDRDLGKQFPQILKSAGLIVERHADHFAPDTDDEVWLEEIGKRGWVALTHDRKIRYKKNEQRAVIDHSVALLIIIGAAPMAELAEAFVGTISRVARFLGSHTPPFIAKVYRPNPGETMGKVELWLE